MIYMYFISFVYNPLGNKIGFGTTQVECNKPIESMSQLYSIADNIAEERNIEGVSIISYQLLRVQEAYMIQ